MKINTTKKPSLPFEGAKIEEHKEMGTIDWNPENVSLYVAPEQKTSYIGGHTLREQLKDQPVLNATVLDYLWEHQDQIPASWKERDENGNIKFIYFWGTIFRSPVDGDLCVRYLFFLDGVWLRYCDWLSNDWLSYYPAALLASSAQNSVTKPSPLDSLNLALENRITALENKMSKLEKIINLG